MGKEVKIGLVVMGVLLCVFGGALLLRLRPQKPAFAARSKSADAKQPAEKSAKKAKAKISAGKHPPAFGAPRREPSEDASVTADPFAAGNTATDDRTRQLAADKRQSAWSDRYANVQSSEPETEPDTNDVPDVADSPYGGGNGRNAFETDHRLALEDTPEDADSEVTQDDSVADGHHEGAGYRQTISDEVDRYGHADTGSTTDEDAVADDRFAGGVIAEPNEADQNEAVADEAVVSDAEAPPRLAFDRYRERSEYQLPPLATNDPDVRPAVGNAIDDADAPADDSDLVDVTGRRPTEAGPPRRLADAADGVYVVEPNDNFWIISQKLYGTGAYFKALQEHNRPQSGGASPLNVGEEISAPPLEVLRESYPTLCPKPHATTSARGAVAGSGPGRPARLYTVAEGDTLFDIARHELGKASRWLEIYELNRDQLGGDFNYLAAGMQLQLPGDEPEPIASRPRRDSFLR